MLTDNPQTRAFKIPGALVLSILFASFANAVLIQLDEVQDAYFTNQHTTFNYGSNSKVFCGSETGNKLYRFGIRFAVEDSLPNGATVDSADISLYFTSEKSSGNTLNAYRVIRSWNEGSENGKAQDGSVCWNSAKHNVDAWATAGCDNTTTDRSSSTSGSLNMSGLSTGNYVKIRVTNAAQNWNDGTWNNYGLVFILSSETGNTQKEFLSVDDGGNVPYMQIWYRVIPEITGLSGAANCGASQSDSSTVQITYEVNDENDATVTITAQYQVGTSAWVDMTNTSGDVGSVATSPIVDRTLSWDVNGQLGNNIDSTYTVRVIASDGISEDTVTSTSFGIDTKNPTGLASFQVIDSTATSFDCQWTAASDAHFSHYEIWYGTNLTNVEQRNPSAFEWDPADDSNLSNSATTTTDVILLEYNTKYYLKIWAIDSSGNEMTVAEDSATTLTSAVPLVTGWDPEFIPVVSQFNTDSVQIGYEVWDEDDSLVTMTLEMKLKDDPGWDSTWTIMRPHVMGDTGDVADDLVEDYSIYWGARSHLGVIDTTAYVRVIGIDPNSNKDTATSAEFIIDTENPTGLASLAAPSATSSSITLTWTAATDGNFNHYEIWYGTNQTNVQNRSVAAEWDDDPNDANLSSSATTTTTVTGLLANTTYYLKIWAVDDYGNEMTITDISRATSSTDQKQLTNVADNSMSDDRQDNNFGGNSIGGATAGYDQQDKARRTLVRFDDLTDSIPAGATINSAIFYSYCSDVANNNANNIACYRVLRDWIEGSATDATQTNSSCWKEYANENLWTTQGCASVGNDREGTAQATTQVNGVGWYNWDITTIVRNWHTGTTSNQGLLFQASSEGNNTEKYFDAAEGANVPYLQVQYVMQPPEVSGLADTTLITAYQADMDSATIKYEVSDPNNATVTISLEYKLSGGGWAGATNTTGDVGAGVDATNEFTDRTIRWGVRTQLGSSIDATYYVRVIADDGTLKDTTESEAFGIDTKAPTGMANLSVSDSSSYWIECSWTVVSVEGHFSHYEIWYGSNLSDVQNRTGTAGEWDGDDNNGMNDIATETMKITGLASSTKYYFKIWAQDSMGNEAEATGTAQDSATTLADPIPTVTGWEQGAEVDASQINTTDVEVGFQVVDIDEDSTNISLQFKKVSGGTWTDVTPAYTSGDTGRIDIGASDQDTIIWDAYNDAGVPTSTDEAYLVRIYAVDDSNFSDTTESGQFNIDFVAPVGLASLATGTVTATSVELTWTAATTESNWGHYEVWYGANQSDVQNRTGTAIEWDDGNDANLATMSTTTTTPDVLNPATLYYFKIWAADSMGNDATVTDVNATTSTTNDPVVTGLDDAPYIYASQYSTTNAYIGYEVDDANHSTVTIGAQYQLYGTSSWTDLTNTTGDIGAGVSTSATANDTIDWTAATQLGAVDSIYTVRVIAEDATFAQDTTVSDTFGVDTKAPAGLANLTATDTLGTQITFTWTAATDRNFDHYEIWYGTVQAQVQTRTGGAVEWDNTDDANLINPVTATTTVTGLTVNTSYYWKLWAIDNIGNESTLADILVPTKAMVTPQWSKTALGEVKGGAITESVVYIGTGATSNKLESVNLSNGSTKWTYSTSAYGACNNPTYIYTGSKYKVIASAGNYVVGRQDNGASSAQLFSPINLGAMAGNPYASPDDSTFYVTYTNKITKRKMSDGSAISGWPKTLSGVSTSADPAIFNDEFYVATTGGVVHKYDSDGTPINSFNAGASVNQPLIISGGVLYITPNSSNLYAVNTSTMTAKWGSAVTLAAANSGECYTEPGSGIIYVACGSNIQRVNDNGGSGSVDWTCAAGGTVESGPIPYGNAVYFGRNGGRYYAADTSNGNIMTNWPYTAASGNGNTGPWVDETNSRVIFGTTGGNLNSFTLE